MARSEFSRQKPIEAKTDQQEKPSEYRGRTPVELQLDGPISGDYEVFAFTSALAIFTGGKIPNSNERIPQQIHEKKVGSRRS